MTSTTDKVMIRVIHSAENKQTAQISNQNKHNH